MSTPEQRLAALLRSTEADVHGDGLARIRTRVVRRKRVRLVLVPAAALAVVGLVATVALSIDRDPKSALLPGTTASPTLPSDATQSQEYDGPAIWPFTDAAQVTAWRIDPITAPYAADVAEVAKHFVTDYLHLDGATVTQEGPRSSALFLARVGGRSAASLNLVSFGDPGPWTVVSASTPGLRPTSPEVGEQVTSPLIVTGTLDQGVDENVRLTLLAEDGREIAQSGAPAGSEAPWSGTLTWTDTTWTHGALVGQTFSPRDGSLTRLFVVPVTRA